MFRKFAAFWGGTKLIDHQAPASGISTTVAGRRQFTLGLRRADQKIPTNDIRNAKDHS